jgi:cysteine sulfinate desulfinase/cysteine desulfurase-like protein
MTFVQRAANSANSVATETISTLSDIGTALAEGAVVAAKDIRAGIQEDRIRPGTVFLAAAIGLVAVVELPVVVAAGGVALVVSKLRNRTPAEPAGDATVTSN